MKKQIFNLFRSYLLNGYLTCNDSNITLNYSNQCAFNGNQLLQSKWNKMNGKVAKKKANKRKTHTERNRRSRNLDPNRQQ